MEIYIMLLNINKFLIFGLYLNYANSYTLSSFIGGRICNGRICNGRICNGRKYNGRKCNGCKYNGRSTLRMEDFGIMKNTGIGFEDLWDNNPVISERALEKELNKEDLRYRMNRTEKECEEVGSLGEDIKIGPIVLKSPRVATLWEAMGFTATSNNVARQKCKLEARTKAEDDPRGLRAKHLGKYGYPRLVGTNGIFYADQLSSDIESMDGFGMGKSGVIWPVPDIVKNKNVTNDY